MDVSITTNKLVIEVTESPVGRVAKVDIPVVLRTSPNSYRNWRLKEFKQDTKLKERYFQDDMHCRSIEKGLFMDIVKRFAKNTDIEFVFK